MSFAQGKSGDAASSMSVTSLSPTTPNAHANFHSRSEAKAALHSFLHLLKSQYHLTLPDIVQEFHGTSPDDVPLSVFAGVLSPAEGLCFYLKEQRGMTFSRIGDVLHRDERGIWSTYHRAQRKQQRYHHAASRSPIPPQSQPSPTPPTIRIPLYLFSDRKLSILENVAFYLHSTLGMGTNQIAKALNKRQSVIHTTLQRAKHKHYQAHKQ